MGVQVVVDFAKSLPLSSCVLSIKVEPCFHFYSFLFYIMLNFALFYTLYEITVH